MAKMHGNGGESSSMRGALERGMRGAGERMRGAGERIESRYEDVREGLEEVTGRFGGMVREHPVMTILAGVGLGFLVGRLLSRD